MNSANQLLHKSLSSEKEYQKSLKRPWNTSKNNQTVKSKVRCTREMKKQSCSRTGEGVTEKKQYLQELLDLTESLVVTTYEKGNYVDSIRQVYIKLQIIKVGTNNVKEVIEALLGDLTNVTIYGPLSSAVLTPMLLHQYAGEVKN